ncbi:MAG: SGNH/GDSL hydrolase family protein [Cyclobacteriaceae bacterium]
MPRTLYLAFLLTFSSIDMIGQGISKNETVRFLALGDSYTIGESVAEVQRWPEQLVAALKIRGYTCHNAEIIAMTGWRTNELKKYLAARNLPKNYNLVSLLIGVNNQYQGKSIEEYKVQFEELLNMAIEYARGNNSRVFVLSIPDYGFTPFGKEEQRQISQEIDAFNRTNKAIAGEKGVVYVNITDISRKGLTDPDLIAEDGLHPSGKMYALWVERILGEL